MTSADDPRRDASGETLDPAHRADRTPTTPWAADDAPIVHQALVSGSRRPPGWGSTVANGLVAAAGVWLVLAPFALGYEPVWNDVVVGLLLIVLGVPRVVRPGSTGWLGVGQVVLGAWLIAAPFVLGVGAVGTDVDVVTGIGVVVVAGTTVVLAFTARRRDRPVAR